MAYNIVAERPGGPEVLVKKEFEIPVLKSGEVLIRQTAIGVNFLDVYFRTGLYPWPVDENLVLGSEAAGVIEEISPDVNGFSVGDRVVYTLPNNAYTTHRVLDAKHIVPIPEGVSDKTAAAAILKGLTTYYLLHDSFKLNKNLGLILGDFKHYVETGTPSEGKLKDQQKHAKAAA